MDIWSHFTFVVNMRIHDFLRSYLTPFADFYGAYIRNCKKKVFVTDFGMHPVRTESGDRV